MFGVSRVGLVPTDKSGSTSVVVDAEVINPKRNARKKVK